MLTIVPPPRPRSFSPPAPSEFWERYVRWLEAQGYKDEATAALHRATVIFCRGRPEIHLFAMHFDERRGDIEGARARYKKVLEEISPRLISATTAAANFEKRQVGLPASLFKR